MSGTEQPSRRAETCLDDCSLELALIIDHALAPLPDDRFASAAELAQAIQRVVPLDSRHAAELGRLVRSVRGAAPTTVAIEEKEARPPTVSRPTVPG